MDTRGGDGEARQFLQKKMESARWLIDSIQQRRRTVLKVATEIVRAQEEFLEKGLSALKPLKMQEVADRVGVHVATVSRAVRHKYLQTSRGLLPMKFFFTGGTQSEHGEVKTWDAVKQRINEMVAAEDKSNPLSDDEIVKKLAENNIRIARRTVTKYRKALNIPTSRQRRAY
jgi:RNA polymerase sigma-54 factor